MRGVGLYGRHTRRRILIGPLRLIVVVATLQLQTPAFSQKGSEGPHPTALHDAAAGIERSVQGGNIRFWFSNEMKFGSVARPYGSPNSPRVGMAFGGDDSVEHLYGAGPWIGGKLGDEPVVLVAHGNRGETDFKLDPRYAPGAPIYTARSHFLDFEPALRGCDDDGDGLIDEDPLDGFDNDGDWVLETDDVGSDGLPDIYEVGCRGGYDSATNHDPAFDNLSPFERDLCHPDSFGNYPVKNNPWMYGERNRMPDHGEPHVDEDYGLKSDVDNTFKIPGSRFFRPGTVPFNVELVQTNHVFYGDWLGGVAPIEFLFINRGDSVARDVYLGFFADMDVGHVGRGGYYSRNYSCYIESLRTAYTHNPTDPDATPAGVTLLDASGNIDSMNIRFHWLNPGGQFSLEDETAYRIMADVEIPPIMSENQLPNQLTDTRFLLSVGPYPEFKPGDTLMLSVAFVGGERINGNNSLTENAARAIVLYERDFHPPVTPSSPVLTAEQGDRSVHLRWDIDTGYGGTVNPWDLYSTTLRDFPADDPRRSDPPCEEINASSPCPGASPCRGVGDIPGGRVFEGFRLYRYKATDPYEDRPELFSLVREYDLDDEFGYNFGIDSGYTDGNLHPGSRYWYSVRSFGIPEVVVRTRRARDGNYVTDTIRAEGPETTVPEALRIPFDLKFPASEDPGRVKVVPNPYRADRDYTREGGGWEGSTGRWTEFDRVLKFINLPRRCTIRIYGLTGDIVKTFQYEAPASNPNQGEFDWDMISEGRYFIASGVYIYTVDSEFGTQIGKFVVIK